MATRMDSSDSWHLSRLMIGLSVLAVLLALAQRFTSVQRDSREPPFITSKIPILGHVVHLIREGADYYGRLDRQYHLDLYALPILKGRMYIVASPEWATAIHRAHKTLHFNTLIAQAIHTLFCMDDATMALINDNLNGEDGNRDGIMLEIHDMMVATLAPGPHLDNLNKSILNNIAPEVNQLARGGTSQVKLWEWLRHNFSMASVAAIWGPQNPFSTHPDAEPAFWEFEANAMPLTMYPLPQVLARKGYKARQKLFESFEEYVENEGFNDPSASQLVKNRANINLNKFNLSKKMHAYGDTSLLLGALLNTIPAAFWLIGWIFEDNELLDEIRREVDQCIKQSSSQPTKRIINATRLRTSCPLFSSAFRETLRVVGSLNSNRYVAEDTTVTNNTTGESYLLKKGSVVQIAGNVIHFKPFWGSDALSWNPRRFMPAGEKAKSEAGSGKPQDPAAPFRDTNGKIHSAAFRSFGGGNNICPGRYFAQTEILALASLFIAGFEIKSVGGNGNYTMPPYEDFKLMMSALKPGKDVEVDISRRKGFEDAEWEFEM